MTHMVKLIFKAYKKNCNERYQNLSEDEKKKEGQKDKNVWFPSPDRPYAYPKKYLDLKVEE